MEPLFSRDGVTIYCGDALAVLRGLPDESVQCCVTSPPYWGLRAYLPEGHPDKVLERGLEETPEEYVERMVEVFREVRRVLRDDGTAWIVLGDSYATQGGSGRQGATGQRADRAFTAAGSSDKGVPSGLKPKDLAGIPWRVAFALQADGWWLRSAITWCKAAPMPESVTDRPTCATEMVFLLAKSERYFYDQDAVREPTSPGSAATMGRNQRNFLVLNPEPYGCGHFAVMPSRLVEFCVKAGTSADGCCARCGAPRARVEQREHPGQTVGWRASCECRESPRATCVILDPFLGSGTTAAVSQRLGRKCIGIELNPEYARLAASRFEQRVMFTPGCEVGK